METKISNKTRKVDLRRINRERSAHFKSIDDHAILHCEIITLGDEIIAIVGDREI